MVQAHYLFQSHQFEEARKSYKIIQKKYPGDAYVIAKITDLDIIIDYLNKPAVKEKQPELSPKQLADKEKREQEFMQKVARERTALMQARQDLLNMQKLRKIKESGKTSTDSVKKNILTTEKPVKKEDETVISKKEPVTTTKIKHQEEKVEKALEDFQIELAKQYPTGMTEETYMDGNVKITKRVVVENNKGNEYKKAEHPWGAKYFFKNDSPITEREWQMETDKWNK